MMYAIEEDGKYLDMPDFNAIKRWGDKGQTAKTHSHKGTVTKFLNRMQKMGVWKNAKVVEL